MSEQEYELWFDKNLKRDDFLEVENEDYKNENIDEIKNRFSRFNGSNVHIEISHMQTNELPFYSDKL